jgi:hypothetical protein
MANPRQIAGAALSIIVAGATVGVGISMMVNSTTTYGITGIPATFLTILLPVLMVVGLALYFLPD